MGILRSIIDFSSVGLGKLRRNRLLIAKKDAADGLVKINLGCGLRVAAGWLNLDASLNALFGSWPSWLHGAMYHLSGANRYYSKNEYCDLLKKSSFIHHDLSHNIPFRSGVADFVYSSHFLEHLFKHDGKTLIKESFRVLKSGGTLRVCVPDLAYAIGLYKSKDPEKMLQKYFFVDDKSSYFARHKYMYDFNLLSELLSEVGFQDVQRCEYQKGSTPQLTDLDVYPEDTLFVEAKKP